MNCPHCSCTLGELNIQGTILYCAKCEHSPILWSNDEQIVKTRFDVVRDGKIIVCYYHFEEQKLQIIATTKMLGSIIVPLPTSQDVSIYVEKFIKLIMFS